MLVAQWPACLLARYVVTQWLACLPTRYGGNSVASILACWHGSHVFEPPSPSPNNSSWGHLNMHTSLPLQGEDNRRDMVELSWFISSFFISLVPLYTWLCSKTTVVWPAFHYIQWSALVCCCLQRELSYRSFLVWSFQHISHIFISKTSIIWSFQTRQWSNPFKQVNYLIFSSKSIIWCFQMSQWCDLFKQVNYLSLSNKSIIWSFQMSQSSNPFK